RIRTRFYQDQITQALGGRSGLDALCATVELYLNELRVREERLRVLYVLMGEALGPVPEMRPAFGDLDESFRRKAVDWIEAGVGAGTAAGAVRAAAASPLEAAVFAGTLRGVALQWLTNPGAVDLDRLRIHVTAELRARLSPGRKSGASAARAAAATRSKRDA